MRAGLCLFAIGLFLASCNNVRYLQNDQALYKDSQVKFETEESIEDQAAVENYLLRIDGQKPNRQFLGIFVLRLWIYNQLSQQQGSGLKNWVDSAKHFDQVRGLVGDILYTDDDSTTVRQWLINSVGEAPVLYDSAKAESSVDRMLTYLRNIGYFHPGIELEHQIQNKKGKAVYHVYPGSRYGIRSVKYEVEDSLMAHFIERKKHQSALQPGKPYNLNDFKSERTRIRDQLREKGYFKFERIFVEFPMDSTMGGQVLDVYVRITNPPEGGQHKRYRVGEIYVISDYHLELVEQPIDRDTLLFDSVHLLSEGPLRFRPATLTENIYFRPGQWYKASDHQSTLRRLNELGAFKFVSLQYAERQEGDTLYLDAFLRLQPTEKQGWSAELNTNTNFNSTIGSDFDFSYRNRNLFRNADLFTMNLTSGLETQSQVTGEDTLTFIGNLDVSVEANLAIPRLLFPFKKLNRKSLNPSTEFSSRYTFTRRLGFYTLNTTSLGIAFQFQKNPRMAHRISLVEISLVDTSNLSQDFRNILADNLLLTQSFEQTIIPASSYTFLYNTASIRGSKSGIFYRSSVEMAGNLSNLLWTLAGSSADHNIAGIPLAQYTRLQSDLRYYYNPRPEEQLIFRVMGGIGVPYGNSATLPFIKQFFSGGPSSVRAWKVRRLGPGSFSVEDDADGTSTVFIDQTGDIQLEANFEYRFPVYKLVKGAFFVDAGNIWLLEEDENRPGGKFTKNFYQDIAIGTGLGLRLDFQFFVIRSDFGFRLRDPSFSGGESWVVRDFSAYLDDFARNTEFNIAIGYPF